MLQQTQVKTALPFFRRWMRQVPSIRALAKTEEHELLTLWQGLGYYSRARNLKKAAQYLVQMHSGKLPQTLEELVKVPGIGNYSAGAILSIAYNKKAPIVDGNVLRVLSRVYAIEEPINDEKTKIQIKQLQEKLVPEKYPGVFNEALMELGALICSPRNPECPSCPVKTHCVALQKKMVDRLPQKRKQKPITRVHAYAVILKRKEAYFIHKRPQGQIMGGLWEFPEWKMAEPLMPTQENQRRLLSQKLHLPEENFTFMKTIRRHYTRFQEWMNIFACEVKKTPEVLENNWDQRWIKKESLKSFPLTSAHAKIRSQILET